MSIGRTWDFFSPNRPPIDAYKHNNNCIQQVVVADWTFKVFWHRKLIQAKLERKQLEQEIEQVNMNMIFSYVHEFINSIAWDSTCELSHLFQCHLRWFCPSWLKNLYICAFPNKIIFHLHPQFLFCVAQDPWSRGKFLFSNSSSNAHQRVFSIVFPFNISLWNLIDHL